MKRLPTLLCLLSLTAKMATAQMAQPYYLKTQPDTDSPVVNRGFQMFNHLDLSVTGGTTGIGFDLASPIGNSVQLRAGFAAMPRWEYDMHFHVQVGDDAATSASKFQRLSGLLEEFTGYKVDDDVRMIGKPSYHQLKLMFDVMPFQNKNWHVSAGFFLGPKKFAEAFNSTEDMPSLVAVGIYNKLYDKVANSAVLNDPNYFRNRSIGDVLNDIDVLRLLMPDRDFNDIIERLAEQMDVDVIPGLDPDNNIVKQTYQRIANYGRMGIHVGNYSHDILYEEDEYYEEDVLYTDSDWEWGPDGELIIHHQVGDVEHYKGEVKHAKGEVKYHKGEPYMLTPDENSMVRANWIVNNFRPYLGFGYGGRLMKNDDRWKISFDCGAMFWGGTPRIVTHEGIDLCKDVEDISGDVGRRVRFFKKFKAFPIAELRITYRLW